jgi:steroid 5-alpha reductase family enzyme
MNLGALLVVLALFMTAAMAIAWMIARKPGKSGWTDAIWSYVTGAAGATAALSTPFGQQERHMLVAVMIGLWGLRLGSHIARRSAKGHDDPRYAALRKEWGGAWEARLFKFLMIQAAAGFILVLSVLAAASSPAPFPAWSDWAGLILALVAIAGEDLADRQLRAFAAGPANKRKVMDRGLWAYSRHPNYFFEWLGWCSYALIALGSAANWPWAWAVLSGPIFIGWLLVHASGIPPLEEHMLASRGDAYRDYQRRVNPFFPGPARD